MLSETSKSEKENYCVVLAVVSFRGKGVFQKPGEGKDTKFLINGLQTRNLSGNCFF